MTSPRVALVAHTHWDREWYEPFQRFRMRLVELVDDVLVRAEADPRFHFTFDGQMAAVEDFLEVRPDQRDRFGALVRSGQFAIGPWRVLLDEFLCSGENIIRNLQVGDEQAAGLGPKMAVGYLPDMFGHIAQMPQILRLAGFDHACVWRGVPARISGHAFRWQAPDGSDIRTEYLAQGYGNVSDLFADPPELPERLQRRLTRIAGWFGDDEMLAMYGTDHSGPLPSLMTQVRSLDTDDGQALRVTTLGGYLAGFDPLDGDLPVVTGELRSHARANILPGVISIRPALKIGLAHAERLVERYAEPLAALFGSSRPDTLLRMAWLRLIDSSCHDSVTGCGVDDTAVQVGARIAEAGHLGQAIRDAVTAELARVVPADAALVFNPTPRSRRVQVELDLPSPESGPVALATANGSIEPVQELSRNERLVREDVVDGADLATLFRRVHDRELFGRQVIRVDVDPAARAMTFLVAADPGSGPWDAVAERTRAERVGLEHPGRWTVRIVDEARRRVVADLDVPALGVTSARLVPAPSRGGEIPGISDSGLGESPPRPGDGPGLAGVGADETGVRSADLEVTIAADGTLTITADGITLTGVGRVVEGGDIGDSYNFGPPPGDPLISTPESVHIRVLEPGPLRARVAVVRTYHWPVATDPSSGRSATVHPTEVEMIVELRRGERFVRLDLGFDNQATDHRVRLHVPCARPAATSHAEGQFAVVERGRTPESGPAGEFPIATYPASSFVDAGGVGIVLDAVTEYELLQAPDELAITLVRGVAFMSRNVHPYRDEPAGPHLRTPLGQSIGPARIRVAVFPHAGDWAAAELVDAAEEFRCGAIVRPGLAVAGTPLPGPRVGLEVAGQGVVLSAVVPTAAGTQVRVWASTPTPTRARIRLPGGITSAAFVGLLGQKLTDISVASGDRVEFDMRPWEIATVLLS